MRADKRVGKAPAWQGRLLAIRTRAWASIAQRSLTPFRASSPTNSTTYRRIILQHRSARERESGGVSRGGERTHRRRCSAGHSAASKGTTTHSSPLCSILPRSPLCSVLACPVLLCARAHSHPHPLRWHRKHDGSALLWYSGCCGRIATRSCYCSRFCGHACCSRCLCCRFVGAASGSWRQIARSRGSGQIAGARPDPRPLPRGRESHRSWRSDPPSS